MEDAIRALTCLMADPGLYGVLIKGPAGTGKSSVIHSFSRALTGRRAKVVPQNITDEQLFGTIDLEEALMTGRVDFEPGLLGGDNDIILVDDINLLSRNTAQTLMDSVRSGLVRVEREGLSVTYPCSVSVVATANDREQPLNSAISDLFDMCVVIPRDPDGRTRVDIMKAVDSDPGTEFETDQELIELIASARERVDDVRISDSILHAIVDAADEFGLQGMRGEISAARVCRASAALDGRDEVNADDLSFALRVCIPHRRTRKRKSKKEEEEVEDRVELFGEERKKPVFRETEEPAKEETENTIAVKATKENAESVESAVDSDSDDTIVLDMGKMFETIDLLDDSRKKKGQADSKLLRRYIKDAGKDGRYVSSRPADECTDDLAIDATIRYAAPYQAHRREQTGKKGVIILPSDLRQKVREKHTSCLFFFMVDNSGSLVIRARMRAVKAAILSMLSDHYVRKDSVAIMTFNEEFVGMLLPPTRSVGGVKKVIDDIPTGMKTPLGDALMFMQQYLSQYLRKHPSEVAFVVMMTDAGANIPVNKGADPLEESLEIATHLRLERMECVLVDTKVSVEPNYKARKLAVALEAPYYKIEDLRSSDNILTKKS